MAGTPKRKKAAAKKAKKREIKTRPKVNQENAKRAAKKAIEYVKRATVETRGEFTSSTAHSRYELAVASINTLIREKQLSKIDAKDAIEHIKIFFSFELAEHLSLEIAKAFGKLRIVNNALLWINQGMKSEIQKYGFLNKKYLKSASRNVIRQLAKFDVRDAEISNRIINEADRILGAVDYDLATRSGQPRY